MARALGTNIRLEVVLDDAGAPLAARALYSVVDGAATKSAWYEVPTPDYTKVCHDSGAVGEFWKDLVDAIKAQESI